MSFEPRVKLARELATANTITAMIDLSDGLSRDLRHICQQSGAGAILFSDEIPVHDDAVEMRRDGHSPLEHALHDGEDYELLFTSAREFHSNGVTLVGQTTKEPGIWLDQNGVRTPLEPRGWEHRFAR